MVKQEDPDTAITVHTIRMWCKEGKIKCLTAGKQNSGRCAKPDGLYRYQGSNTLWLISKSQQNKKGELQAKIQVSGKDLSTGKSKVFTKRVYNTDELTRG